MDGFQVSIVIPTYNEANNLPRLVESLEAVMSSHKIDGEIIFVDDASPDRTGEVAENLSQKYGNIRVIHRLGKMGLGSAILTGFEEALAKSSPQALIQMDADFSHPPETIPNLLGALSKGNDVAVASRYRGEGKIVGWTFFRKMVSLGANGFARIVLGLDVKDVTAGFKAYGAEAARFLVNTKIRGKSFEYQPESLFRVSRAGFKITEIPFTFRDREVGKSKFKLRDIFSFSWKIMMIRFRS